MGKKMKLPWEWPSCRHPKTHSFRAGNDMFKTVNSIFFGPSDAVETPESYFTKSSKSASFSNESEHYSEEVPLETIISGVRSERLFFEPDDTSSILIDAKAGGLPFEGSVAMAMESEDPYKDFKRSMEEMVESHGLRDWECLEELLGWYLRMNGKMNHGFIVGAFFDLVVGISGASCFDSSTSFSSVDSSFSSPSSPL
ncbi:unnamed protein product [Ilex paraguariensis]|uniref:Transcription repressor n=1 Tax=Ilex paraguariensis TaxID=185542 RepID=A0ABC8S6D1_9AQUA